jgi:hypothetical protein
MVLAFVAQLFPTQAVRESRQASFVAPFMTITQTQMKASTSFHEDPQNWENIEYQLLVTQYGQKLGAELVC